MEQIKTTSLAQTEEFAINFAKKFTGSVIALIGELGAGKTTFVKGFAKGLGITDQIISPTFVLMRQHKIPNSNNTLYHLDLYRLEGTINTRSIGLNELFHDPHALILIEWADRLPSLPPNTNVIKIDRTSESDRLIIINHKS